MTLADRIDAFVKLGSFLSQFTSLPAEKNNDISHNELFFDGMKHQLKVAKEHNNWFTEESLQTAITQWTNALTKENLETWTKNYALENNAPKTIAVIMAGNIPLVGFHDFLSVLISGHHILVKQSSNDKHLLPFLAKYLEYVAPDFKRNIKFTEEKLADFDAVIATGSNNTARYFDYYFKDKPNIIRHNRNSVAVLTGNETEAQLQALSNDIFQYFGLGCRSVSKIFVPQNYDFDAFFKGMYPQHEIIHNAKYANNYDYNKAVYLMSLFDILDNGFMMIKEDESYASPIATVFYEYYEDLAQLKTRLQADAQHIQCVVTDADIPNAVAFGHSQQPRLEDYADGVDTLRFLTNFA